MQKKDISSYDLVGHRLKFVLHILQQRLHLQRSQRSVNDLSRRVSGCFVIIIIPCMRTHVLRQLLHVLRIGAIIHPVIVDILALVILLDVGHPRCLAGTEVERLVRDVYVAGVMDSTIPTNGRMRRDVSIFHGDFVTDSAKHR